MHAASPATRLETRFFAVGGVGHGVRISPGTSGDLTMSDAKKLFVVTEIHRRVAVLCILSYLALC